ncbi:hypothetical protein B5X24_HaOG201027 [Helicoverpa armigera]|uniref:Uncharacterized protein n=1 Tax=Helicoverpa armigera TaxID=29058 RepID=A0A2W1C243_HELAM|nr:hypothetical protein B5X24_HaOG201027 [Helicoverpa armigera]
MISLKSVITIKTLMAIRLGISGLYFPITSNKIISLLLKIYCAIFTITVMYYILTCTYGLPFRYNLTSYSILTMYFANVIHTVFHNGDGEYLKNFFVAINKIDLAIGERPDDEIKISRLIFIVVFLVMRTTGMVIYCQSEYKKYCSLLRSLLLAGLFVSIAGQWCHTSYIMMFESVYHRMRLLRKRFENRLSASRQFEADEKVMENQLRQCLDIYKNLLGVTGLYGARIKIMVITQLFIYVHIFLAKMYILKKNLLIDLKIELIT